MEPQKRKAIQAAGGKVGDAADFLEMSDAERQLLDARVELALAVRRQRKARRLSQKQLGAMLQTSQPGIARIERAAADVSLDQLVRAFAAAGGKVVVKAVKGKTVQARKTPARQAPARKDVLVLEVATSQ